MAKIYRGTIRKMPSGSWCAWFYVDDPATGKRKQKNRTFATRKEAEAHLTLVKSQQLAGTYTELQKIGFASLCQKYLTEFAPLHIGELTLRAYRSEMKPLTDHFGERPVATIHPADVQGLVAALAASTTIRKRRRAPKSVNNCLTLLHRVFQIAKKWGYVRENPAADIEHLRTSKREMSFHTRAEIGQLLSTATGDSKAVLALALLCGLRRGEIAGLRWDAIDFAKGQILIKTALVKRTKKEAAAHGGERWLLKEPKSEAGRRVVDMVPAVQDILELHRLGAVPNPLGLVFTRPGKGGLAEPWDPQHLADANYVRICKQAKVRVLRLHDCRHTHTALRLAAGTTDPKYLQRQMGHSSIGMTLDVYGHLFQEASAKETDRLQAEVERILAEAVKGEAE